MALRGRATITKRKSWAVVCYQPSQLTRMESEGTWAESTVSRGRALQTALRLRRRASSPSTHART